MDSLLNRLNDHSRRLSDRKNADPEQRGGEKTLPFVAQWLDI
jgi:hypothetical protein